MKSDSETGHSGMVRNSGEKHAARIGEALTDIQKNILLSWKTRRQTHIKEHSNFY